MNKFYSSLVISQKTYPGVHQIIRPRYNKEFFKRLTKNIDQLEAHLRIRPLANQEISRQQLSLIKNESQRYVKLKDRLETIDKYANEQQYNEVLGELNDLQEQIMPIVVNIPNRMSRDVPKTDQVLEQIESTFLKDQNLTKHLNHTKLSYINRCYSKSVVGPNSHYYTGIGAKLQLGLNNYFTHELEKNRFIPISGLCLAKSALVEACNSKEVKDYATDPCRILKDEPGPTTLHMIEASREALAGFLTSLGHIVSNESIRLMCSGSGYRKGSEWFDGNGEKVTQFNTIHSLVWNSSIEQYSIKEFDTVRDIIWSIYKNLELPSRLVHCSLDSLHSNEYDAYRIEVWLPSQNRWIMTSRISHYLDYITVRLGMKRGHLLDAMIYDGQVLGAAIIENRQNAIGRFMIPTVLQVHMPHLTNDERANYFDCTPQHVSGSKGLSSNTHIMTNYVQRRFLVKKTPLFSHSVRAQKNSYRNKARYIALFGILHCIAFVDWEEVFFRWLPLPLQRFLFDTIYRRARRIWWNQVYVNMEQPPDLSFDETDRSRYEKTMYERNKEERAKYGIHAP